MKKIILSLALFGSFAAVAQDNPYEIFGQKSNVVYETKVSDLFKVKNNDVNSQTKALAFNIEEGYVLFLGEKDSVLSKVKVEPDQLLRFLSVDPAAKDYPGISPYAFVNNNPINAIDPDGRKILFVNGHYQDNWVGRNIIGADKGGQAYWGTGFATAAQGFFNDKSKITSSNYINGSSSWGGDMSGQDRYDAGYEYAKANIKVLTADMVEGETFKMVTHSEGAAYGAGVAQYLIDQGYKVETIVHLSADEGDEFKTPTAPTTYQFGYQGDWVTGNKEISGVDKSGIALRNDLGPMTVHGTTKSASVFNYVQDLITVQTQQNIGMIGSQCATWESQVQGTTSNGTTFTNINGNTLSNTNGTPIR
ncbi:MAG: hypothetical protein GYA62_10485 [Bacteroidales bacterium]|nr:hypothetical protein [Bacteroidales bacterium]